MTKRERDIKSRERRLKQWVAMTEALAAIADYTTVRTLREARMRAQSALDEITGSGTPSSSER